MAVRYELRTFKNIVDAIMEACKFQAGDTVSRQRIKRNVNMSYLNEVVPYKQWHWLQHSTNIQQEALFQTGYASVTAGSVAVTLSETPTVSYRGYGFSVDGQSEIHEIKSHSANGTAVILDLPYTGPTSATVHFKIWRKGIILPQDCKEVVEVTHNYAAQPLMNLSFKEFRRVMSGAPKAEGRPAFYTTSDFKDPYPYSEITGLPATLTRMSSGIIRKLVFASSLGADGDTSLLRAGDQISIESAGVSSYNIPAVVSAVTTTNVVNDTIQYTAAINLNESATSDTGILVRKRSTESFEEFRELLVYPSLFTQRTMLAIDYTRAAVPLQEDSDEPLMPREDRMVLFYSGVAMSLDRERNPEDALKYDQLFQRKLDRMAGKSDDSPDKPMLVPSKLYLGHKRSNAGRNRMTGSGGWGDGFGGGGSRGVTGTPNHVAIFNSAGDLVSSNSITLDELANVELLNAAEPYRIFVSDVDGILSQNVELTPGEFILADANGLLISSGIVLADLEALEGISGNIQDQLDANALAISDHIADPTAAHAASAISVSPTGNLASTDAQSALAELQTDVDTRALASRLISTTAPITGGGSLAADRTLAIAKATTGVDGYLAAADFTTFNNKVSTTRTINTTAPITGGGDLSADRTLAIAKATGSVDGYLAAADFTIFNAKQAAGNYITALTGDVTASGPGSVAGTIAANAVTNAKAAQMAAHTFKGNNTGSTANALDLTATQLTAELNVMVGDSGSGGTKGLVPAPATGDANKYLTGAGTYVSPAGGGGGGSLSWVESTDAPISGIDNLMQVYYWEAAQTQNLYATIEVPTSYVAGNPIKLKLKFYSSATTGTALMSTQSTLIRSGTDAVSSTTNQRTSTNTAVTLSAGTVNIPQAVTFDVTSSTGTINSVAVAAGDLIKVRLFRGTDTSTPDILMPVLASDTTIT